MRAWRAGLKYGNGMESSGEMILPRLYSPFHTSSTYYTTHSKKQAYMAYKSRLNIKLKFIE